MAQAPNGDLYAGLWWFGGIMRSTDGGVTWAEVGLSRDRITQIVTMENGWILASSSNGDVSRSQDNGDTWAGSGSDLTDNLGALAYDPVLDILYAAGYDVLSRSTDGGDSWEPISTNFPDVIVTALAVVPNGGALFVGTDGDKVFRSQDGGVTWSALDTGMDSASTVYDLLIDPDGYVLAATWGGYVYRTEWAGTSWTQLNSGLTERFLYCLATDGDGQIWAGTAEEGVFVSNDSGLNWTHPTTGLESQEIRSMVVLAQDDVLVGSYGGGVYHTTDGVNWAPSCVGMNRADISKFARNAGGTIFASTHGAGVAYSLDDGVTWSYANTGFEDYEMFDIIVHPDGDIFTGTWESNLYRSQDNGGSWTHADAGLGVIRVSCLAVKSSTGDIFAGGLYGGGVWRSIDKGDNWTAANTGLIEDNVNDIFVEGDGGLLVATAGGGIFRSVDDGDNWTPLNNGLTDLYVNEVLATPCGVLFAATANGGVCRSLDDGTTWERVDSSLPTDAIASVAVNSIDHVFVANQWGADVYRSMDDGATWHLVSNELPNVQYRTLGFNADMQLLLGTSGLSVLYTVQSTPVTMSGMSASRSDDGSVILHWYVSHIDDGPGFDVHRTTADGRREKLTTELMMGEFTYEYVDRNAPGDETHYWLSRPTDLGNVIWYGPIVAAPTGIGALGLSLDTAWPNPFTTSTSIGFRIPVAGVVDFSVFDLRGRRVRRLIDETRTSGSQSIEWDGRDDQGNRLRPGTYVLRIDVGDKAVTRKVQILGNE